MKRAPDLTGLRFGRLLVIRRTENVNGRAAFTTECECGTVSPKQAFLLSSGKTQSCGCLRRDLGPLKLIPRFRHGFALRGKKPKLYSAWVGARLSDKNVPSFEIFSRSVGPCPPQKGAELRRQPDGTYVWRRGRKLNESDVREIRGLRDAGYLHKEIASQFGIHQSLVQKIVNFQSWKDIKE
jgi:hypothetical protein